MNQRLLQYARVPLELNGKAGEEVFILTDSAVDPRVGEALAQAARELGMEPSLMVIPPRKAAGHEPPRSASEAMKGADLIICATSTPMTHTDAVRAALGL